MKYGGYWNTRKLTVWDSRAWVIFMSTVNTIKFSWWRKKLTPAGYWCWRNWGKP